jgi:predicted DNA-binding mobile mystery protein A
MARMATDRTPIRRRLDARFDRLRNLADGSPPHRGWLRAIRDALGMSSAELGARLGVSSQTVLDLERSEQHKTIRLETLQRAADALDSDLVYVLLPRVRLDDAVEAQARRKAMRYLNRVAHHSRLEDQSLNDDDLEEQLNELASNFIDQRGLWSEDGVKHGPSPD